MKHMNGAKILYFNFYYLFFFFLNFIDFSDRFNQSTFHVPSFEHVILKYQIRCCTVVILKRQKKINTKILDVLTTYVVFIYIRFGIFLGYSYTLLVFVIN